jgi:hypothetical protein
MSAGHWLKREFYVRKTRKVFGHYNDIYGNDLANRTQHTDPHPNEPAVKPQSLFQHLLNKGIMVFAILVAALGAAYVVINFL